MPDMLKRLSRMLARVTLIISAAGLTLMTLVIFWQVFARYVLQASPSWSEQAALLLMIWFIFLATAVGVRESFHIRITAMVDPLENRLKSAAEIVSHVIVGAIGLGMVICGIQLTGYTWSHNIPSLGISRGWAYIPIVISGAMIVFFAIEHIIETSKGREVEPIWN